MQDEELFSGIEKRQSFTQRYLGLSTGMFFLSILIVVGLGIHIGVMLFGDNSLEVLLGLEEYESYLESEVQRLKSDNAALQKDYFELKELERDTRHD